MPRARVSAHEMTYWVERQPFPIGDYHTLGELIETGFGNDDRLMEQALDEQENERIVPVVSRAALERQQDRLAERIAELEKYGDDVYEDDTVLLFKLRHRNYDTLYTYTALKAGGGWWMSGNQGHVVKTWDQLVEFLSHTDVAEMWIVEGWLSIL